ncbi:hypothetical protein NDU88_002442 [Pleurodeles waltl]|uniref:Uncharacterized protein n=1 Tax=Pleurodeles waltl TaxID=8319 RepID=A0AAV7VAI3_PLEWA|nr:hypothetical protein NDU88_002442 [Pleurodeles waltl]
MQLTLSCLLLRRCRRQPLTLIAGFLGVTGRWANSTPHPTFFWHTGSPHSRLSAAHQKLLGLGSIAEDPHFPVVRAPSWIAVIHLGMLPPVHRLSPGSQISVSCHTEGTPHIAMSLFEFQLAGNVR